ncbi:winged helix-turn-helix domain-containing protein [Hyphomonas sp.]|uniref:winged helix-turn-helix domain-containing tetratricopeptide repeat protein n=1 Tax=Hyphomonas sp. TaxID=87 RepID=UPI0025C07169|nr:winged helix-turn-helix domain-containing protein [Hyphomonas sp.]
MLYQFGEFELDTGRVELRSNGVAVAVEPQVFALIRLLVENRDRVVTKDEIVEKVWNGRIVSDSAISSRVKSARQAIGDDGRAQTCIRTVHGIGFSFVAEVATFPAISFAEPRASAAVAPIRGSQPSIAVIPFDLVGSTPPEFPIADALPHDLITDLSRLHWLLVIARGSSFRFRGADVNLDEVRNKLSVQYCLTGTVEISGKFISVSVELSETEDKRVVWCDRYRSDIGAVHEIRDQIVKAVTSAVEVRIPSNEAQRALLKSPENLDAWSTYHLGVHHMYRFNKSDNEVASGFFKRAIAMEPGFARAYAGLSFTHFQSAFLRYDDNADAKTLAQHYAAQCVERDPLDPFGHFTMGRAQWLRGDLEASVPWLERASALNPNYAQAKYSTGWAEALLGSAKTSQTNIAAALVLSPLDPLVYGMLGVRALSYLALEDAAQAAEWAERAANSPGSHALIEMIAAAAHGLNGDVVRAKTWAASVHARASHLNRTDFLRAFPFRDEPTKKRISGMLEKLGL